jgi:hypothetical protein
MKRHLLVMSLGIMLFLTFPVVCVNGAIVQSLMSGERICGDETGRKLNDAGKTVQSVQFFSPSGLQFTFDANTNSHDKEESEEGATIAEHRITASELERLRREHGVWEKDRNFNQLIDGHGTGLRPPADSEWTDIGKSAYVVENISLNTAIQYPSAVDHTTRPWFPPIGDQDGEGSCTAWAVGYYMKTFQEAKEHEWNLSGAAWEGGYLGRPTPGYQDRIFSPDFIYHLINNGVDEGSSFYDAINLVCGIGACSWKKMPYDPMNHANWPSEEAWKEAPYYRGDTSGYEYMDLRIDDYLTNLKNWIATDHLALIEVDANRYLGLTSTDFWTLDNYVNPQVNHANTIVGYDDNIAYTENGQLRHGAFKIANSWGIGKWEKVPDGFYWISYEAMKQRVMHCMFYRDRIGYTPELVATFRIDHPKRGECNIFIGTGNHNNPLATKSFSELVNGVDQPFCPNNIVFDVTEFKDVVPSVYGQPFFMRVYDGGTSATGTILYFAVENTVSPNPPVTTVNGGYVFADLILTSKLDTRILFVLSPNPATPGQLVTLLGNLTESQSGTPVANAQVDVHVNDAFYASLWSNSSGWFRGSDYVGLGTYKINVTYSGDATHNPSDHTVTLIVQEHQQVESWVYFNFAPDPATPGSTVKLKGVLVDNSSNPISSAAVTVEYSTNNGGSWNYIWTLTANQYGMFSQAFSAPGVGRYLVRVSYAGDATHKSSSSNAYFIVLSTTPGGTTTGPIYFNFIPNPATSSTSVVLKGILLDVSNQPVVFAAVKVEYSTNNGASWNYIWALTTNQYGIFSQIFTAPATGTYLVRVSYSTSNTTTYLVIQ